MRPCTLRARIEMISRYRYKRKFVILLLIALIFLLWCLVHHSIHESIPERKSSLNKDIISSQRGIVKVSRDSEHGIRKHAEERVIDARKESINAANVALMLRGINETLIKLIKFHMAKKIPFTTPRNAVPTTTAKQPTTKPSIDIVNDYYPFVDFKFVFPEIYPKVETTPQIFMIILVNSGAKGEQFRKRREAIRETWASHSNCEYLKALEDERMKDLRWLLVFVVGKAGPGTNDDELNKAEAREHNDMLIGNITDNYINNVVKFFMGQVWASRFDIKYTFKTDDDVYVRIPRVLEYIVNAKFPKPFYAGMTYLPIRVNRVIGGKWTVSWKYFGEVDFPMFNAGAFFILSTDLLNRLFNYANIRKPFHTDDAYVGIAMRDFGVKITTIFSFAVRPDMNEFVRKAEDCKILRTDGFGHNMDAESDRFLHDRLKTLACGNTKTKC